MRRKSQYSRYFGLSYDISNLLIITKDDAKLRSLIFESMKTKETGISGIATQLLTKSAMSDLGLKLIFQDSLSQIQDLLSNTNETIRFRALDLVASAAASRISAFQQCESNGLLQSIIKAFDPQDLLQTLNFIELYDKVSKNRF